MHESLSRHMFSLCFKKYLGLEFSGLAVTAHRVSQTLLNLFPNAHPAPRPRQQHVKIPPAPHPQQHWVCSIFYIFTILAGVKWYLIMVLICILLKANTELKG